MSLMETVMQTTPNHAMRMGFGFGGFIFALIGSVSVLIVTVGVFYVLMKLGGLLDAKKERTESSTKK